MFRQFLFEFYNNRRALVYRTRCPWSQSINAGRASRRGRSAKRAASPHGPSLPDPVARRARVAPFYKLIIRRPSANVASARAHSLASRRYLLRRSCRTARPAGLARLAVARFSLGATLGNGNRKYQAGATERDFDWTKRALGALLAVLDTFHSRRRYDAVE